MNTPDLRPIGALTPEILSTASHWCLLHGTGASVHESKELHIDPRGIYIRVLADEDVWPGGSYMRIMHNAKHACYPCTLQPNGLIVPEPWPVLDGEEEIEHMRGVSADYVPHYRQSDGTHLSPRKGKTGIVWVWEKDRC